MAETVNILDLVDSGFRGKTPYYRDRTRAEKIKYCGRYMYTKRDDITRVPYDVFEFPCGIVKGDEHCYKCRDRSKWRKKAQLKDRITRSDSATIFKKVVTNDDELRRTRQICAYHNLDFLAVPTDGGKVVYINGKIKDAVATNKPDVYREIEVLAELDTGKNISGSLGKEKEIIPSEPAEVEGTPVKQRLIRFKGKSRPTSQEYLDAATVASIRSGWVDLDEENIQKYITTNDNDLIFVLKEMGFNPYFGKSQEALVNIEILKQHMIAVAVSIEIQGELGAYSIETIDKIDNYKKDVLDYAREKAIEIAR